MCHDGRVYPSAEELVIYCEVAGNECRPVTVEGWNDGLAHGIREWKRAFVDGIECGYAIVSLLRSMIITGESRRASH